MFHVKLDCKYWKLLCLSLWAWKGWENGGTSASFDVKAKSTVTLFPQVSLYGYLLPVLDEKHILLVIAFELMINSASVTFPSSIR